MSEKFVEDFDTFMEGRSDSAVKTMNNKPVGSVQNVDPDTLKVDGQAVRLKGFNAPETAHIRAGIFTPREEMYDTSQQDLNELARLGGYTNIDTLGKDKYKRLLGVQNNTNVYGSSLGDTATKLGLQDINSFSNLEAIKEGTAIRAAAGIFPELAAKDPMIALAMKRKQEADDRAGANPQYIPRINVNSESEYASYKNNIGVAAIAEAEKEVNRLEGILKDPTLRPELRTRLEEKLEKSKNEIFQAAVTPDYVSGVNFRRSDRNIMNQAHDQMSTSFNSALLDMGKMFSGVGQMTGDNTKWEWLSKQSKDAVTRLKTRQDDLPTTLSSLSDVRTDNSWNTVKDTATLIGNTFAGTVPLMATMIAANAATAGLGGVAGFAAGSMPNSLLYAGGFYADQPDDKKNTSLAMTMGITSGVLDNIGLQGMMLKNNLFTLAGKNEVIEAMTKSAANKGKVLGKTEAEDILQKATKKQLVDLSEAGEKFALRQIASKEAVARGMGSLAVHGGSESVTEGLQQAAEQVAIGGEWNTDAQYEKDFYKQIMDAAVGGAIMGGGLHFAGQTKDYAQWHSLADSQREYTKNMNESQMFQADNHRKLLEGKGYMDIAEGAKLTDINKTSSDRFGTNFSLYNLPALEGAWNGFKSVVTDPGRLMRQHANTAVPSVIGSDGKLLENKGLLKAIMGGFGLLPGNSMSVDKRLTMGRWGGNTAELLAGQLGTNVETANAMVRNAWQTVWSKELDLPQNSPQNIALQKWFDDEKKTRQRMQSDAQLNGVDDSSVKDDKSIFQASTVHPQTLQANKNKVVETVVRNGGKANRALKAIDMLLSGNPEKAQNGRDELAMYGVFEDPKLAHVFENNVFTTIENLKDKISNSIVHKKFLGKDGEILGKLLARAWDAGEFKNEKGINDEHAFMDAVKNTRDWYEMTMGTYNPIDKYPNLQKVISWGTTMTMLASLGKAALSSQVEVAMSTLGTPADLINKQLKNYSKILMQEIGSDINKFNSWSLANFGIAKMRATADFKIQSKIDELEEARNKADTPEELDKINKELDDLSEQMFGRKLFQMLGYDDTGYNTQSKFEYEGSNQKRAMHVFSSAIGLRAQTDSTRIAVLSVAADTVVGMLTSLRQVPKNVRDRAFLTFEGLNKDQAQSLSLLQQYGMNVPFVIDMLEKADKQSNDLFNLDFLSADTKSEGAKYLRDNIVTTLGNFVDSRIVNPQPHNLPKYYHDPRLRVITAMGRFMASAHATLLPKLYREYMMNGNVGMRYQAFSTIAMSLLFAALVNDLKDQLSYDDESPYIKGTRKRAQRNLYTSGLTGQYEKAIDMLAPLYPQSKTDITSNPAQWALNKVKDVSPVVSWAARPVQAALYAGEGKTDKAVKQIARATPVIGSFPVVADMLSSPFKEK